MSRSVTAAPDAPAAIRASVLGCPVDVVDVATAVAALARFIDTAAARQVDPALVVTLNPEMVMRARRDPRFRALLHHAALLVPDGIGIVRALRRRGYPRAERVTGADLLATYLPRAAAAGHRIAFCGAAPGVAAEAARRLQARHPGLRIVAADPGAPDAALAARLHEARPQLVLAAFGAGAQEVFLARHLADIGAAAGMGVGGTFDYLSGRLPRAPAPVQRAGLEWAWRLAREPRRVRRQLVLPAYWLLERREAAASRRGSGVR